MGNQEFGSWIWKGIELGHEKWEMGTKSEFSSLKVRPPFGESMRSSHNFESGPHYLNGSPPRLHFPFRNINYDLREGGAQKCNEHS